MTILTRNGHKPFVLWLTGLSGAGKSTIASALHENLNGAGIASYILDGDIIRRGLSRDLGYSDADRAENIRRVGEVAKVLVDAGLIVIVSMISPFRAERHMVREMFEKGRFIEVFVDTPFDECAQRDTKGLYAKAKRGELKNFTGLDSPYERPNSPEVTIKTVGVTVEESVIEVERFIRDRL